MSGSLHPFEGEIRTQSGILQGQDAPPLKDKEIITMDWLCDNVEGCIPALETLRPEAQETSRILAIHHD